MKDKDISDLFKKAKESLNVASELIGRAKELMEAIEEYLRKRGCAF